MDDVDTLGATDVSFYVALWCNSGRSNISWQKQTLSGNFAVA